MFWASVTLGSEGRGLDMVPVGRGLDMVEEEGDLVNVRCIGK
jgi:hypothetical protein